MIPDRLYDLAFEYKKTKLWNKLSDSDIFAVKLSDGKIGYCSVMGMLGEFIALGLYIGSEGWNSYLTSADTPPDETEDQFHEVLLAQDCVQCVFENKDSLSEPESAEVQRYAKTHNINLRGRKSFPQFVRCRPCYYPWHLDDKNEQGYMSEALSAAIEVAGKIAGNEDTCAANLRVEVIPGYEEVDIDSALAGKTVTVPLLILNKDKYEWSKTELPVRMPVVYPSPALSDIAAAKILKMKKKSKWECEAFHFSEPLMEDDDSAPYFPVFMMAVDTQSGFVLPMVPMKDTEKNAGVLLSDFADAIINGGACPGKIAVRDKRTEVFLGDFCRKTGIPMIIVRDIPTLEKAKQDLLNNLENNEGENGEEFRKVINMLKEIDDATLMSMPVEYIKTLAPVIGTGILPYEVELKLKKALHRS